MKANITAAKKEVRRHQRIVKKAVEEAKEAWINRVSKEADYAGKNGKQGWESIGKLQMVM